jgi:hypothetical protein
MSTDKPTRVVWTNEEKKQVFRNMAGNVFFSAPNTIPKTALSLAQLILPFDRRMKVTDQRVFVHKAKIQEAKAEALRLRSMSQETVALMERDRAQAQAQAAAPAEPEPEAEAPRRVDSLGDLFELLVDAITERVMQQVRKDIEAQMSASTTQSASDHYEITGQQPIQSMRPKIWQTMRPSLPTVTIIGLNGKQIEAIKRSHPRAIYNFFTGEEAKTRVVHDNDYVILMTKFINHSAANKYRKAGEVHFCNGGVSELKTLLTGLLSKEQS